ncbi:MAG: DUF4244 domain-containing protein [Actinomycetota bacterium]|nr:DUF4244 domain-containing protein [Actinomycetota bacterium]
MTRSRSRPAREAGMVTSEYAVGTVAAAAAGATILLIVPAMFSDLMFFLLERRPQILGGLW